MPDFQQTLAHLRPDELQLLLPAAKPRAAPRASGSRATVQETTIQSKRRTRRSEAARDTTPTESAAAGNTVTAIPSPAPVTPASRNPRAHPPKIRFEDPGQKKPAISPVAVGGREEAKKDPLATLSTQPHPLPVYQPKTRPGLADAPAAASKSTESASAPAMPPPTAKTSPPPPVIEGPGAMPAASAEAPFGAAGTATALRQRQTVEHVWPPTGTVLTANYFGTIYRAEIVAARKKLKSGKQVRLLDGPAKGKRLDSLSAAMLAATARQRKQMKLGRKGASNGWEFWKWA